MSDITRKARSIDAAEARFHQLTEIRLDRIEAQTLAYETARTMRADLMEEGTAKVVGKLFAYRGAMRIALTFAAIGLVQRRECVVLFAVQVGDRAIAQIPFETVEEAVRHIRCNAR